MVFFRGPSPFEGPGLRTLAERSKTLGLMNGALVADHATQGKEARSATSTVSA